MILILSSLVYLSICFLLKPKSSALPSLSRSQGQHQLSMVNIRYHLWPLCITQHLSPPSGSIGKAEREGLVTATPPWDRAAAGHVKLPVSVMLSEDDSHTGLNCHLSIQGLQSHLQASWKVLMSHQTTWKEIPPPHRVSALCQQLPAPRTMVLFHTCPGWERGFSGSTGALVKSALHPGHSSYMQ